jgi:hypothetical protein
MSFHSFLIKGTWQLHTTQNHYQMHLNCLISAYSFQNAQNTKDILSHRIKRTTI